MRTAPVWPTQKAGDFRQHIKLEVVGGRISDNSLKDTIQKAYEVGYSLGEKHTRAKMEHPALDAIRDTPTKADVPEKYDAMVNRHRQTLRSK